MNIRNKPCNCGSNKKYKKCCWNPNDLSAALDKQRKEFELKRLKEEEERLKEEEEREKFRQLHPNSFEIINTNNPPPRRRINAVFMLSLALGAHLDMRHYNFR